MRELVEDLRAWLAEGRAFAVASVIGISGSAPRQPGAALAVCADGTAIGSVSGGCVEGAVYELCAQAIEDGQPVRRTFGYSDDDAFAVGLTCGGIIEVLVWPVLPSRPGSSAALDLVAFESHLYSLRQDEPVALVRAMTGEGAIAVWPDRHLGSFGDDELDRLVAEEAGAMLDAGQTGIRELCGGDTRLEVFVESHRPPPRMIVFGAIDFAGALTRVGRLLGYHVTVCDARPVFATRRRFPDAHEVVVEWPHRYLERTSVDSRTVIAVLTHDPKFDLPLLELALRTEAAYVGAMGSRRTHEERLHGLRALGVTEGELARLRSPIGLDLGARTPEETAISIAAEFVALSRGGGCLPLSATTGPIHQAVRLSA